MNKRVIKITFFCAVLSGMLLLLCVLGMKQLQVIGSVKTETESETKWTETELAFQETEQTVKTEQTANLDTEEIYAEEISAEENYENDSFPYYIKVNRQANCVTIYIKDDQGEYTIPVKAMVCSVGLKGNTPLGVFRTSTKYNWRYLYGDVYGQYAYRINGPILFHSVPYYKKDKSTLKAEEYNKLGEPASKGCVRLSVEDAKWLIDNCPEGTTVEIYDSEDPGPLGKPEAIKIDTSSPNKGWDPTDPDEANPWKNQELGSENSIEVEEDSTVTENWMKEYAGGTKEKSNQDVSGTDQTAPAIQVTQENLTAEIPRGKNSEAQLLEQAKDSAIQMVSSNVLIEEESFYTNVLHVESVEKEYQEGNSKDQLIQVRVTVKISVEDAYQNRSEKYVTVLVEIRDASG